MRAVLQRVSSARVVVGEHVVGAIGPGLMVLLGVETGDGPDDVRFIAGKIRDLRIFDDDGGLDGRPRMNRSVADVGGQVLVVSQFTLAADVKNGRRPSFVGAAAPDLARALYEDVVRELRDSGLPVETGQFQATMQVALVNEGPVTILLDSRRGT
ncbi:MAG: D-aminoacyl-tRNA deacylase [Vicinamibacterales bacterium]